jgi:hypothetical protein
MRSQHSKATTMKTVIAILAAAVLSACATTGNTPELLSNLPPNYKAVAVAAVKKNLKDPDSVKTLRVGDITTGNGKIGVFVYVNAKNSFGAYTGEQPVLVMFKNGSVVDIVQ